MTGMKLLAAAIAGLGLGWAGQGLAATTLYLDVDGCGGAGCGLSSYGTATITNTTSYTQVEIDLAPNVYFDPGDNHLDAAAFDVVGTPNLATTVLTNGFSAASPHLAGSIAEGPVLGNFQYVVDWYPPANQANLQQLVFRIFSNFSPVTLNHTDASGTPVYLAVDVERKVDGVVVAKGEVGGGLNPPKAAVPEPAAWALMLVGFFGVGSSLRTRRRVAA